MPARIRDSWGNWHDLPALQNPEGGGGVTLDNTVDPPAAVTTIIAPGADVSTPGEATLASTVTIFQASVTLTNAQIKALPTTPIQIVAAQGAGTFLKLIDSLWILDASAAAYTNVNATLFMYVAYQLAAGEGAASTRFYEASSGFFASPEIALIAASPHQVFDTDHIEAFWIGAPSDYSNRPFVMTMSNGGAGALTGGNAANSLKVTVWYAVFEV